MFLKCGASEMYTTTISAKGCKNTPTYMVKFKCRHREPTAYCTDCINGRLQSPALTCVDCGTTFDPPITAYDGITELPR